MTAFNFTFKNLQSQLLATIKAGYTPINCIGYYHEQKNLPAKTLVTRVDIDLSVKKTEKVVDIFNELGIKASFFLRLHAPEYNPFSFEHYRILKKLLNSGHELGYHSEIIDQSIIWEEDAADNLLRDIDIMNRFFGIQVQGVASHGGMTGLNNLDFWKQHKAQDFGLLYEAYEETEKFNLFKQSFYISDSEWTRWKCYKNGVKQDDDHRSLQEHLNDNHPLLYLLIHPDTYFNNHFYE